MKIKTYWCNSCTVKINGLWHGSWELYPLKSLQIQFPDISQDHFSIIAPTNKHIYQTKRESQDHTKKRSHSSSTRLVDWDPFSRSPQTTEDFSWVGLLMLPPRPAMDTMLGSLLGQRKQTSKEASCLGSDTHGCQAQKEVKRSRAQTGVHMLHRGDGHGAPGDQYHARLKARCALQKSSLGWCGSVGWALAHAPGSCRFNS